MRQCLAFAALVAAAALSLVQVTGIGGGGKPRPCDLAPAPGDAAAVGRTLQGLDGRTAPPVREQPPVPPAAREGEEAELSGAGHFSHVCEHAAVPAAAEPLGFGHRRRPPGPMFVRPAARVKRVAGGSSRPPRRRVWSHATRAAVKERGRRRS